MRQAVADRARGRLRRHAVEVGSRGSGGGRGVGDLLGVGGRRSHPVERNAQVLRDHLAHLGVDALTHLRRGVVHDDGAVGVDVDQGTRLIEVREGEGDAELHGVSAMPRFRSGRR